MLSWEIWQGYSYLISAEFECQKHIIGGWMNDRYVFHYEDAPLNSTISIYTPYITDLVYQQSWEDILVVITVVGRRHEVLMVIIWP